MPLGKCLIVLLLFDLFVQFYVSFIALILHFSFIIIVSFLSSYLLIHYPPFRDAE